ncbi:MAG: NAD-dependent epimerase/dehydratase family protein [Acholeplasmataceae bacterium]|nr:NAD-dependent epimerase/dehydratase family protein [Acholeplasmataceae bacterium]
MKKILITGANSYIGDSLERWLQYKPNEYTLYVLDVKNTDWQNHDFSKYQTVVNVAGIAHVKENDENKALYYEVNRDLAYEIARKAKNDGVKQFIFFSSMSVYGLDAGIITRDTVPRPKNNYGKSKLEAEQLISTLDDDIFAVAIIRPPMVYGKGCKGNYVRLSNFAKHTPFFPNINNKRSMIYINNLTEFIKLLIDDGAKGLFFPQNDEYVNTSEMVKLISEAHGKNMRMIKIFNPIVKIFDFKILNKVFGSLIYEQNMSKYVKKYCTSCFNESVFQTEMRIRT